MNQYGNLLKEIPIWEIENIKIGNAEDMDHATGCTVILCEKGMPAGIDVRGGGPASRETELLNPVAACQQIHAVLLSGGSAYGLDAAGGVMEYLAEQGYGFALGDIRVPLVVQSCIFDLLFVTDKVKPDKAMARKACENAQTQIPREGNHGAGCGATVGKLLGGESCMNSGLGFYAVQLGDLKVGAVVSVNALGDVYDERTGQIIAGCRDLKNGGFADSEKVLYSLYAGQAAAQAAASDAAQPGAQADAQADVRSDAQADAQTDVRSDAQAGAQADVRSDAQADVQTYTQKADPCGGVTNTTIGCIITNARFDKSRLNKIAAFAQNGYARSIRPVHTMNDGDTIYALSAGDLEADIDVVGTLASTVMAQAVRNAVLHTETFHGLIAAKDLAE